MDIMEMNAIKVRFITIYADLEREVFFWWNNSQRVITVLVVLTACSENCITESCDRDSGNCTGCENEYWGAGCRKSK